MKETIEIILQHGWGFDGGAWNGWRSHLAATPEYELTVHCAERGYFGCHKFQPEFSSAAGRKVLIAHSSGLHFVPPAVLAQADLLVVVSSFAKFHGGDALEQRRSRRSLQIMLDKFAISPLSVLDDFYCKCYHPLLTSQLLLRRATDLECLDLKGLQDDLQLLDSCVFDPVTVAAAKQVLILHGEVDKIVNFERSVELQQLLPNSTLIMFEGVGHALPFTHVAPCWLSIRNALRSILPVGRL